MRLTISMLMLIALLSINICCQWLDSQLRAVKCYPDEIGQLFCEGDTKWWCNYNLKYEYRFVTCREYQKCNTDSDGEYFCTNLIPEAIAEQWGIEQCCMDIW